MKKLLLTIFISYYALSSMATGQAREVLIINGDTLGILSEPLEPYLQANEPRYELSEWLGTVCHTALWRGYIGYWELIDDKLYLIDVFACGDTSKSIKADLFPTKKGKILANWFTGSLNIPKGKLLQYFHMGHWAYYEQEIEMSFQNGVKTGEIVYSNGLENDSLRISRKLKDVVVEIYKRIDWSKLDKYSKQEYEIKLAIDSTGVLSLLHMGRVEKVKGTWKLLELHKAEIEYKEVIQEVINSFPLIKRYYYRGESLPGEGSIIIVFSKRNKKKYVR